MNKHKNPKLDMNWIGTKLLNNANLDMQIHNKPYRILLDFLVIGHVEGKYYKYKCELNEVFAFAFHRDLDDISFLEQLECLPVHCARIEIRPMSTLAKCKTLCISAEIREQYQNFWYIYIEGSDVDIENALAFNHS